tara:strand:- start:1891 stop:2949 length:1059 start_codon:yes stop_codon:yes gene_type:complete
MEFKVGRVKFSNNNCVIIAEAGVNHLGDLKLAESLISSASKAGADIIKFQTYKAKDLTTKDAPRFWKWDGEIKKKGTQYDSYSILDKFGKKEHLELKHLCEKYDIEFMSTPFSIEAAEMLIEIGMQAFKIASCDITNLPFLKKLAEFNKPILLSTGAANIEEINKAVEVIKTVNPRNYICIMHCILCYPTEYKDANLMMINDIKKNFPDILIGLSDHTIGIQSCLASIPLGSRVIEKHYTIDKTLPKSADHWLSIDTNELMQLKKYSKEIMDSLGQSIKEKIACEDSTHKFARRSIVSTENIKKGDYFNDDNLSCKRPGTGLQPAILEKILGKKAKRDISGDSILDENDIDW